MEYQMTMGHRICPECGKPVNLQALDDSIAIENAELRARNVGGEVRVAELEGLLKTASALLQRFDYRLNWANNARRPRQAADEQLRQLRKDYRIYRVQAALSGKEVQGE